MFNVLVTTVPFGQNNLLPIELLETAGVNYIINPLNKKLTENELADMVSDIDLIIAGTEVISDFVMSKAKRLKMISRVGIGLDGVDLIAAKKRGISVSYTPDAPAPAVAELTIGLLITLLRSVQVSNMQMHQGKWNRLFGKRIADTTIGVIGLGRIGSRVLNRLAVFGTPRLLVNDISPSNDLSNKFKLEWVDKETIYKESDAISLHVPLTKATKNMITKKELRSMKSDAILINTCRGGIINEKDLYSVMKSGHLSGAAIDVFEEEPYNGKLREIERCILTAHMGSMSIDCRTRMEIEATEEAVRFVKGEALLSKVPSEEYDVQSEGL
ncbi:phosphoglycerate dehydrogenase [Candidatus Thioglobus sp.]|nr:phosphoglycerate dehydrogenase [Candidatus Thioglobus sp.]